jgi:hypothetical protein
MATGSRGRASASGARTPRFDRSLLLVRDLCDRLGGRYNDLLERLREAPDTGAPGQSLRLAAVLSRAGVRLAPGVLAQAERAFMADWLPIAAAREAATGQRHALTHFQWLAALFVELYLTELAAPGGRAVLAERLNALREEAFAFLPPVLPTELNRLALWMATGSGKTLMLHLNMRQFLRHALGILGQAPQRVLLLTPNEALSAQHRQELGLSGLDEVALGRTLEITELTKLYLPEDANGERIRVKDGVSVCTDRYAGPNLVLVDEGHKGGKSSSGEESAFRERRQALTGTHPRFAVEGVPGFEFEYSATFAQIADGDTAFFNDYARCTVFDYGYRRFHDDGFGKTPKSLVTTQLHAQDLVLAAGLVAFWQQCRFFAADAARAQRYRLSAPLAVFVGQSVTGKSQDVVQVITFLSRFAGDPAFSHALLEQLLDVANPIQQALFAAQLDLSAERTLGPLGLHQAVCSVLFGGTGALAVRPLSKDELGIRLPGAESDRWLGTAYVGDAAKLATALKAQGVTVEEPDAITGSLFKRLDERPELRFLIGARRFIEGWSSFRVSTLGLMKVGRGAGSQVIQLFGRGVRLAGVGGRLKRSGFVPELGPHPADVALGETLYVFGVQAEYVQTWLESLSREGMVAQSEVVPVSMGRDVSTLGLLVPADDPGKEVAFGHESVRFMAKDQNPVCIDLTARLMVLSGVGQAEALNMQTQEQQALALLGRSLNGETLFQHAQRFLVQQGLQQLWVTPSQAQAWLAAAVARLPQAGSTGADIQRLRYELFSQWEAALLRTVRKARLRFVTQAPMLDPLTEAHVSFPQQVMRDGSSRMGYRVEALMADDVMKAAAAALKSSVPASHLRSTNGLDRVLAVLREELGELDLSETLSQVLMALDQGQDVDTLALPLPRLHIPQHLYAPLLMKAPATVHADSGQLSLLDDQPVTLRLSPPPLEDGEARFVWDLRRHWEAMHGLPEWAGIEVAVLRNLSGVGVRLFAAEGFFPDFLLWIKRGPQQALAFIEPKGLRHQWPQDKFDLLDKTVPTWQFSVPVRGFVLSGNTEEELQRIRPGFRWAQDHGCLIHQDAHGRYMVNVLKQLRALIEA